MFNSDYKNHLQNLSSELNSNEFWVCNNIFNHESLKTIDLEFNKKISDFQDAQVGKGSSKIKNTHIRNDKNYWLSNDNNNLEPIWVLLENIKAELKSQLFLPIKRYETQFALYPPGHYYKRHVDKHKFMPARLLTLVFYISKWRKENAGELVIYNKQAHTINPNRNSLVLFFSELEHEVLPTNSNRKSLTTWFRDDIL